MTTPNTERVSAETLCAALPKYEEFAAHCDAEDTLVRIATTIEAHEKMRPQLLELYTQKYGEDYATAAAEFALSADIAIAANTITEAEALKQYAEGKLWPDHYCTTIDKIKRSMEVRDDTVQRAFCLRKHGTCKRP